MRKTKILQAMIESKDAEVRYLRAMVKELNDKIIVIAGKAYMHELNPDTTPNTEMSALNMVTGQIDSIPAITDEEKKQKQESKEQLHDLLNH